MAEIIAVLRGGSRDGESTVLDGHVGRLYAVAAAPGLLDVYEDTTEREHLAGNEEPAHVFVFTEQVSVDDIAPEAIHLPSAD